MKSEFKKIKGKLAIQKRRIEDSKYVHGFINIRSHNINPYNNYNIIEHIQWLRLEVDTCPSICKFDGFFAGMELYLESPNFWCGRISVKETEDLPF